MHRSKKTFRGDHPRTLSIPLRLLIAALLGVLLIPLALVAALHIPAVQDYLLGKAIARLENRADLRIELASARWSPFHELRLFELKVKAAGENVLECAEANLGYHFSWKWPYLHPLAIVLDHPSLRLERDAQGHWQFPGRKGSPSESSRQAEAFPWSSFPWPQVRIVSGSITALQNGQAVLSIADMNATLSVQEMTGSDGSWLKIDFGQWQGEAQVPPWGRWLFSGAAEIRQDTLTLSGLELIVPGAAHLLSQGQWQLAPPYDGTLELHVQELSGEAFSFLGERLSPLHEATGTLALNRHSGKWSLDHALKTNLGSLQGTLQIEPDAAHGLLIQLTTRFGDLRVPFPAQDSDNHLSGRMELTVTGAELETAQASLYSLIEDSRWGDQSIQRGEFSASYEHGILDLKPSRVQSSAGRFDLSGTADLRGLWDPTHAGAAKVVLQVEQASLDKIISRAAQRAGGHIVYQGYYEAGGFRKWEQWQGDMESNLVLPQFLTLKATGSQKRGLLSLDYELEVTDLQKFSAFLPELKGKGKVSSRGSIKGKYPELLWDGQVSSPMLQIGPVQGEQASLKGKGDIIGKEGRRELSLTAQNLSLEGRKLGALNLELKQEADVCRFTIKSDGLASHGGARLSGRLEKLWDPVRTLVLGQSSLTWGKQSALLEGRVDAGKEGIRVHSLTVRHEGEKVELAGEALFDGKADLKLTINGINLAQWSRILALEIPVSGEVSGQIAVKGRTDQPEATVNLQLVHGAIMIPSKPGSSAGSPKKSAGTGGEQLVDRLQLQASLVRDLLSVQGNLQSPAVQSPLQFSARIPMHLSLYPPQWSLKTGEEIASSAKLTALDAERILPYLDFLDRLGGRIDLEVQVAGSVAQPSVVGNGSWQNGSFRVTKWPHPIENIQLDWQADARQIVVKRSSMKLLGGDVQVTGWVGYPRFHEMDFEAEGTNLEVKDIYGTKGHVSGHARLIQTLTMTRLTGLLNLSGGEMDLGEFESDIARTISVIDGTGKGEAVKVHKDPTQPNSFVDRLEMDLTISLPPSGTWVRGKGLEAEITGTLKIEKQPFARVKLHGGFQTLRGEYRLQDYKLKIVEGELIFPEGHEPDPQLKIVCQKEVKDAIIQVHVTGPLKQPKLVMSSIPAMNQVDILSYLVFDRPAGDLSSNESFQLQDKAASWMGTQTSILLKQVLGDRLFTPDTIEYRRSTSSSRLTHSSGNRTDTTVVAIGKHITPDLYINFEKGITGEEGDQVAVEYRINRYLSVQTEFGGTQQSGIDVFWRYDFGK